MLGSAKLKRIQIDRYVMDKFTEARRLIASQGLYAATMGNGMQRYGV